MIIYINEQQEVLWLHEDNNIKQDARYVEDKNCLLLDVCYEDLFIPSTPVDNFDYIQKWDAVKEEIYLEKIGEKPKSPIQTDNIDSKAFLSQRDGFKIMEMLLQLQEQVAELSAKQ